jgi:hypothetical protein
MNTVTGFVAIIVVVVGVVMPGGLALAFVPCCCLSGDVWDRSLVERNGTVVLLVVGEVYGVSVEVVVFAIETGIVVIE